MKTKVFSFLIWIPLIANLFYKENLGLNTLIASVVSIGLIGALHPKSLKSAKWWIASLIVLASGTAIFINGTLLATFFYFVAFLFFFAVTNNIRLSLPLGLMQSLQTFFTGFYYYFEGIADAIDRSNRKKSKKGLINFLLITGTLIIIIIFLKLYQTADATFYEYTKYINLDWISWGFIAFALLLSLLLYGLFFYRRDPTLDGWEDTLKNDIPTTYTDNIQNFLEVKNEFKTAIVLLSVLNSMLLLYNFIDTHYILYEMNNPSRILTSSEMVHEGVNALILSIVLVILLVTFLFRGQLNFTKNKTAKILAFLWLLQNLFMVSSTALKNYDYVAHWGLTYKRIGVWIWLSLSVIGLLLTMIKILSAQSFWFLFRNASIAFTLCLTTLMCVNWERTMASYNLTHLPAEKIDFEYLLELGPDTYPAIIRYHTETARVDNAILLRMRERMEVVWPLLKSRVEDNSWRSMVWSDQLLYRELCNIKFNYKSSITKR